MGAFVFAFNNPIAFAIYTLVCTAVFGIVTIGGVIDHNSVEARDIREIYKEKAKIAKEKNEHLSELLVISERELEKLRGNQQCTRQHTANRKPCDNTGIAIRVE